MKHKNQLAVFAVTAAELGLAAHILGEAVPRSRFRPEQPPFAPWSWEQDGRFYRKHLKIEKWKHLLPDKSLFLRKMVRKRVDSDASAAHLEMLAQETCVAEATHWALLACSPLFARQMERLPGVAASLLYAVSHLPFIAVQRYNRPRLLRTAKLTARLEACNATIDPLQQ
ncbi:MAG: hypothetical protein LUC21_05985 [Oscillospiraceae bacterium]|nr:hypothetical protein [Oscillospiraceae bacterium]